MAGLAAPDVWAQERNAPVRLAMLSFAHTAEEISDTGLPQWRALFGGLRRLGLVEGETLIVERWTTAIRPRSQRVELARELVATGPDVIFVTGTGTGGAVKAETDTIQIVIGGGDPVSRGLAESLRRPGGNLTGFAGTTGPEFYVKGGSHNRVRSMVRFMSSHSDDKVGPVR